MAISETTLHIESVSSGSLSGFSSLSCLISVSWLSRISFTSSQFLGVFFTFSLPFLSTDNHLSNGIGVDFQRLTQGNKLISRDFSLSVKCGAELVLCHVDIWIDAVYPCNDPCLGASAVCYHTF
nr:MAG TPA: hypothetical protein [Caudoviricetes sp.]